MSATIHNADRPLLMALNGGLVTMDTTVSIHRPAEDQGPSTDIYIAFLKIVDQPTTSLPIQIKAFRFLPEDSLGKDQLRVAIATFQPIWDGTHQGNEGVAPIWPATMALAGHVVPAIATPYYSNGNITNYLKRCTTANKPDLASQLANIVADVHAKGVMHGNICPENVCIGVEGEMCVTDLGVSSLVRQTTGITANTVPVDASWMYKAPEELQLGILSTSADVYSTASTIYSMYTRRPLFSVARSRGTGVNQIMDRGHIGIFSKPEEMSGDLWEIIQCCWLMDPAQRPSMAEVVAMMNDHTA